jgi:WD40 repeat protein
MNLQQKRDPQRRVLDAIMQYMHEMGWEGALEALEIESGTQYDKSRLEKNNLIQSALSFYDEKTSQPEDSLRVLEQKTNKFLDMLASRRGPLVSREVASFASHHGGNIVCVALSPHARPAAALVSNGALPWQNFVPSSCLVASGSSDKSFKVFNYHSNTVEKLLRLAAPVIAIDWNPTSAGASLVLISCMNGTVYVVDLAAQNPIVFECKDHTKWVIMAKWAPDGRHFALAGHDGKFSIWGPPRHDTIAPTADGGNSLPTSTPAISSPLVENIPADGKSLTSSTSSSYVRLASVLHQGTDAFIEAVAFAPPLVRGPENVTNRTGHGSEMAEISSHCVEKENAGEEGEEKQHINFAADLISVHAVQHADADDNINSPEQQDQEESVCVYSVRGDHRLHVFCLSTLRELRTINLNQLGDAHVSFTALDIKVRPGGRLALVATDTNRVMLVDLSPGAGEKGQGKVMANFYGATNGGHGTPRAGFSGCGAFVYCTSEDRTVCVWELATQRLVHKLTGHSHTVRDLSLHPTLPLVATTSFDKSVKLWGV